MIVRGYDLTMAPFLGVTATHHKQTWVFLIFDVSFTP
jgi:hypothetical protein